MKKTISLLAVLISVNLSAQEDAEKLSNLDSIQQFCLDTLPILEPPQIYIPPPYGYWPPIHWEIPEIYPWDWVSLTYVFIVTAREPDQHVHRIYAYSENKNICFEALQKKNLLEAKFYSSESRTILVNIKRLNKKNNAALGRINYSIPIKLDEGYNEVSYQSKKLVNSTFLVTLNDFQTIIVSRVELNSTNPLEQIESRAFAQNCLIDK